MIILIIIIITINIIIIIKNIIVNNNNNNNNIIIYCNKYSYVIACMVKLVHLNCFSKPIIVNLILLGWTLQTTVSCQ